MKTLVKLMLVTMMIMTASIAFSQQNDEDVVYLKSGGMIRGSIIELAPDQYVKVQTADGNVFVYQMNEVEKVTKEAVFYHQKKPPKDNTGLKKGYYGLIDYSSGVTFGARPSFLTPNFSFINGYRINPYLATGVGLGLHYYMFTGSFIPVFAEVRANFLNKAASPYLSFGAGYSFETHSKRPDEYTYVKGGPLLSPSFGVCVKLKNNTTMNFGLSYDWQKVSVIKTYRTYDYYNYTLRDFVTSTEIAACHTISFKIGIGF